MTPFLTFTAVIGLGLDRERGDLARETETEAEEVVVTTRGVAPETENVQADSNMLVFEPFPSPSRIRAQVKSSFFLL